MHIRCPQCQHAVEIVEDSELAELACPSCGSHLSVIANDPTATDDRLQQALGHFDLLERLGSGHFGTVWKARDQVLDRIVALKVARRFSEDEADAWAFFREARAAAQLKHPAIVSVFEVGRVADRMFIVSEYVPGIDLKRWLRLRGTPDSRAAAEICATVAEALHHAHEVGVVHRDIKPANIIMDGDGQPHLTDFGLAKRDAGEITMTVEGQVLGTPAYMSPEQAGGKSHDLDRRADVYSLGVALYEMLAGRLPFRGDRQSLVVQILHDPVPRLRSIERAIPRDLETICHKCLEKEPARRYQTAAELAADLRRYLVGKPILARPVGQIEQLWRWCRRERLKALATASSFLFLLAVGVIILLLQTKPSPSPIQASGSSADELPASDSPSPFTTPQRLVRMDTQPAGGQLLFVPLDPRRGLPLPDFRVGPVPSGKPVTLRTGMYLVVAVRGEELFHEVLRYVPREGETLEGTAAHRISSVEDGVVVLPTVRLWSNDEVDHEMVVVEGAETFQMGVPGEPRLKPYACRIPDFMVDQDETTFGRLQTGGFTLPVYHQVKLLGGQPNEPLGYISLDSALHYLELMGKRLPYEEEYELLATNRGRSTFPWGDGSLEDGPQVDTTAEDGPRADGPPEDGPPEAGPWKVDVIRIPARDQVQVGERSVYNLFSGVAEWTLSPAGPYPGVAGLDPGLETFVVRGGPIDLDYAAACPTPRYRVFVDRHVEDKARLGFRGARSLRPRLAPEDYIRVLESADERPGPEAATK